MKCKPLRRISPWLAVQAVLASALWTASFCYAQERQLGPSPLDTLLETKLWADVPEPKDFVRATRPPAESLDYQPLTGADPERPKLRTSEELNDLQSELENAAQHNLRRAGRHMAKPLPPKTATRE